MQKIRKGDTVQVIKGEDKGKKGKVIVLSSGGKRALVEGINLMKKHKRQTRQDQKGGIVSMEAPLALSNLMFFCKSCNKPSRIGIKMVKDNEKSRFCKNCKELI